MIELKKQGLPASALDNRPQLTFRQNYFAQIYRELSSSRKYEQGHPLGIPVSEIQPYCALFQIDDPDAVAELMLYIANMDRTFQEKYAAKHAKSGSIDQMREAAGIGAKR